MTVIKVLGLTRYGRSGASSRLRFFQYSDGLSQVGISIKFHSLIDDECLSQLYSNGRYKFTRLFLSYCSRIKILLQLKDFNVIWIEKEALPWFPLWMELVLLRKCQFILDYDDAVFHNYDEHPFYLIRRIFGFRCDRLMARAALVVCGNKYLANRAKQAGSRCVEILPTVIELSRYKSIIVSRVHDKKIPIIVWIGSPSTVKYLQNIAESLLILFKRAPFTLRVIGAQFNYPGLKIECLLWTETDEVSNLSDCSVGIMPLLNSSWEKGKCGYKLIQYMACGLPVVASDVGVNSEIIRHGENGFLVSTSQQWVDALEMVLFDSELSNKMGSLGRAMVERHYCVDRNLPKLSDWLVKIGAD